MTQDSLVSVFYVTGTDLAGAFGSARLNGRLGVVTVLKTLPALARAFVLLHELQHIAQFRAGKRSQKWWWLEVKANAVAALYCPLGALVTIALSFTPARLRFYAARVRTAK